MTVGLDLKRVYSQPSDPYAGIRWETRTATIKNAKGETIFEQVGVKVPDFWSMTATNIVVSKYFYGKLNTPARETSVEQLINRVADTITGYGQASGYFVDPIEQQIFHDELIWLLVHQHGAFNSPVWFNVGCHLYEQAQAGSWYWDEHKKAVTHGHVGYSRPQCSACFINSIEDSMEGIMRLATTEAMLFKFGSGTGTNFSSLRSNKEGVSGGGTASGPLSFMKGLDAFAGVIKSGGKTRRAAKMAILNADHPDIEEFIDCKIVEERKAYALMREGYDGSSGPDSSAYSSIFYQNANNSVRVSDEFMKKAGNILPGEPNSWDLKAIKDGRTLETVNAVDLLHKMAAAAWECGDPGIQFDSTINRWHTSKNTGRINASNPCSEYMFLDNSACNLASLNLIHFLYEDQGEWSFNFRAFEHAVQIFTIAQDIIVDMSGYPTESIAKNSHDFRPLGLGYANLGALLMALGLPYDSDEGRGWAAAITAIMTGHSYYTSAIMARELHPLVPANVNIIGSVIDGFNSGACPGWFDNKEPFMGVITQHSCEAAQIKNAPVYLYNEAQKVWSSAFDIGKEYGYRNSQMTVLAPTGTIGFMMDCDTTGIEPELALVKYKKLVGGGHIKIVNETVTRGLQQLGYGRDEIGGMLDYIDKNGCLEGSVLLKQDHLPIFDTSFTPSNGKRSIHYMGHVKMMAATQPFLSGAISKTVNMPHDSTVEDVEEAYTQAWKLGLKSIAIYRDGSKANQVLVTSKNDKKIEKTPTEIVKDLIKTGVLIADLEEIVAKEYGVKLFEGLDIQVSLEQDPNAPPASVRHKLPDTRPALNHKFSIAGHEGYINVGFYNNGQPGEIFITMAKEGSTLSGFMDSFALVFSIALQHGVPLKTLTTKLSNTHFEPSGWTADPDIRYAKSIMDYLARWMQKRFVDSQEYPASQPLTPVETYDEVGVALENPFQNVSGDAPLCTECGAIMVKNASCYRCAECGGSSGCS